MFSDPKIVAYCIMALSIVASPLRHRGLNIFSNLFVTEALTICRVVAVAKLQNCRVPSSAVIVTICMAKFRFWPRWGQQQQQQQVEKLTGGNFQCLLAERVYVRGGVLLLLPG